MPYFEKTRHKIFISFYHADDSKYKEYETKLSKGDFLVLADHDDTLAYDALFECVDAINKDREIELNE